MATVQSSLWSLPTLENVTFGTLDGELAVANATTASHVTSLTRMVQTASAANTTREKSLGVLFLVAGFFGLVCLIAKAVPKLFAIIIPSNTIFLMFTAITMTLTLAASIANGDYCEWALSNTTALVETYRETVPCVPEGYIGLQTMVAGWNVQALTESCLAYRALCLGSFVNVIGTNCGALANATLCNSTATALSVLTLGPAATLTVTAPTAGTVTVNQCAMANGAYCGVSKKDKTTCAPACAHVHGPARTARRQPNLSQTFRPCGAQTNGPRLRTLGYCSRQVWRCSL